MLFEISIYVKEKKIREIPPISEFRTRNLQDSKLRFYPSSHHNKIFYLLLLFIVIIYSYMFLNMK